MKKQQLLSTLLVFFLFSLPVNRARGDTKSDALPVPEEICREAMLPNFGERGRPLPLTAHWNSGEREGGFTPAYQMELISAGHYLLPWFQLPDPDQKVGYEYYLPLKRAAELNLPISFIGTQWEHLLTDDPSYFNLPPGQNPNVVALDENILKEVCPFGPLEPWRVVGKRWTTSPPASPSELVSLPTVDKLYKQQ
jgi:hypothetical protein